MKRKLLVQVTNEWRSNVWLAIELLIISVVVWFILDFCISQIRLASQSVGLDTENCFQVSLGMINESSPGYVQHVADENGDWPNGSDYDDLLKVGERLKNLPSVEAIASGSTRPYNFNFWGGSISVKPLGLDSTINTGARVNRFIVQPDYLSVFQTRGIKGETPEELAQLLRDGKTIITENIVGMMDGNFKPEDLYDAEVITSSADSTIYRIGAVIPAIKRGDYEAPFHATILIPTTKMNNKTYFLRVAKGNEKDFPKSLVEQSSTLNYGNVFISQVNSLEQIRSDFQRDNRATVRDMLICMVFLLITVFLGLLGTFWFRTQQRVYEIALRKVAGATKRQIFGRLISEGLLILLIATPPAIAIDWIIVYNGMTTSQMIFPDEKWIFLVFTAVLTALLIAVMIVGGILFPARKATEIEPADVLRGE